MRQRIGIITDIHFGSGEEHGMKSAEQDLIRCLGFWHREGIDHVLQMGDLIDGPPAEAAGQLDRVTALLESFSGTIHHLVGNHCLDAGLPRLMASASLSSPFYHVRLGSWRFIMLNGMDITTSSRPETAADQKRMALFTSDSWAQPYCGAIGGHQLSWLGEELGAAAAAAEDVVVCCHLPLAPGTTDEHHGILWNHREVADIILRHPAVRLVLGGHYHRGGITWRNGIPMLTLPGFVKRHTPPCFTCGIIELEESLITVYDQQLQIRQLLHRNQSRP
ncbi:MAG: metallophosphoesterase [Prosthecochloris sp.]|nr:metallophosphoesterase [Prosthecochloris sp.]